MKKNLLLTLFMFAAIALNAQTHLLTFETMYNTIITGISGGTETATYVTVGAPKILLNQDRTSGIFTIVSPSTRTARMDSCNATFVGHTHNARIRLEPNGASNTTNGRKIYIDCPAAGKLTVGCWTTTAARGYTVEDANGTVLYNTNASMPAVTSTLDLPLHEYNIAAAGRVVLNPNAGFYYGFVQFQVATGINSALADKGVSINISEIVNTNKVELEVYSVLGKKVLSSTDNIALSQFKKGVYVVRVAGTNQTQKFTI